MHLIAGTLIVVIANIMIFIIIITIIMATLIGHSKMLNEPSVNSRAAWLKCLCSVCFVCIDLCVREYNCSREQLLASSMCRWNTQNDQRTYACRMIIGIIKLNINSWLSHGNDVAESHSCLLLPKNKFFELERFCQ